MANDGPVVFAGKVALVLHNHNDPTFTIVRFEGEDGVHREIECEVARVPAVGDPVRLELHFGHAQAVSAADVAGTMVLTPGRAIDRLRNIIGELRRGGGDVLAAGLDGVLVAVEQLANVRDRLARDLEAERAKLAEAEKEIAHLSDQDLDEAHRMLSGAGIADGALAEKVEDIIEERDKADAETEQARSLLATRDAELAQARTDLSRLNREREELADLLTDMAQADCNCGDCHQCRARRYVDHDCHDGDCADSRVHDCHSSTCKEQQPFVLRGVRADLARVTGERDAAHEALRAIHDRAHDLSTGPTVPDGYWEIRGMAGDALGVDPRSAAPVGKEPK